ncbi:MAG TPA: ATP-binding cassette domain-containing protein [Acidimicrobiales bacterium]|nr:ATP-binding cassette domain-containing protein [Acidimicrobiales bacterium]
METPVIEARRLTKAYGPRVAVDDLSFEIRAGRVTGFLGPNGAGKTTTLRMLLGLAAPTSGMARIWGRPYVELDHPSRLVGVMLDASSFHPRRSARDHLRWVGAATGIARPRIEEVLGEVDLTGAGQRRVGEFSLGMRQRLGLATAVLGDPQLLILDEPANGLDPAGIRWLRGWLRSFARRGGTVFVSSHQLGELAQMADDVLVLREGRLLTHTTVEDLTAGTAPAVRVRSAEPERLATLLLAAGGRLETGDAAALRVRGLRPEQVGAAALTGGIVLHELVAERHSLEDVFLDLTEKEEDGAHVA